jgi:hypothetical protein
LGMDRCRLESCYVVDAQASCGQHESLGRRHEPIAGGRDRRVSGWWCCRGGGRRKQQRRCVQLRAGKRPVGDHRSSVWPKLMGQGFVQQLGRLRRRLCSRHGRPLDGPIKRHRHVHHVGHIHGMSTRLRARCHHVRGVSRGGVLEPRAEVGSPDGDELH